MILIIDNNLVDFDVYHKPNICFSTFIVKVFTQHKDFSETHCMIFFINKNNRLQKLKDHLLKRKNREKTIDYFFTKLIQTCKS